MTQTLVRILYRQIGWMPCVACSDSIRLKGRMWLGVNRWTGVDDMVVCPVCNGTQQVPQYQVIDGDTGQEIDYEAFGRDADGNPIQVSKGVVIHGS